MILSLDLAFRNTGYIIYDEKSKLIVKHGVIKTNKSKEKMSPVIDDINACKIVTQELYDLIENNKINTIITEMPTGSQSSRSAKALGMATAILIAITTIKKDINFEFYTPTEVKIALTNNKNATKDDMMDAARREYSYYTFPKQKGQFEHIADSCGVLKVYFKKKKERNDKS